MGLGSNHHHGEDGRRSASDASTPHALPARPTARPSDASTGTSNSQIHAVPHSETQRLPRYKNATNAAGRVSRPMTSRIPSEISVSACMGAAIAAWLAASPITAFHAAGAWLALIVIDEARVACRRVETFF